MVMTTNGAAGNGTVREATVKAIVAGILFGVVFGAANAYLGLKAGLTVSTSIPIAVLSALAFRATRRGGTILEANLSQTIGSASSSLASGTIFTIPALFMWGTPPGAVQVALLALAGGLLGIFAMVPLRRLLIVEADAELPYPEGRACAEVLRATEKGAGAGTWIVIGIGVGAVVKLLISGFHVLPEAAIYKPSFLPNGVLATAIAPAYVAVGFITGFRASSTMFAGGLLSALVLYPLATKLYAAGAAAAGQPLMVSTSELKRSAMNYLGAGAVGAAGFISIVKASPVMAKSLRAVAAGLRRGADSAAVVRTDRDLPSSVVVGGVVLVIAGLAFIPGIFAGELSFAARATAALGVALFSFLFVPVSSRMVGVIGVSQNPVSAMALITLIGVSGIFLALGVAGADAKLTILCVGTVVCVAASKAGDISQDLKTGWLVGGTPSVQQAGQILAAAVACWSTAATVMALGRTEGFGEQGLAAPQATLMKTVVETVLGTSMPWDLLTMGVVVTLAGLLVGLPALPLALGLYLPFPTMAALFIGGVLRRSVDRRAVGNQSGLQAAVLCASGYVAGEGLAGVGIAAHAFATQAGRYQEPPPTAVASLAAVATLGVVVWTLWRASTTGGNRIATSSAERV
jgi:putative OPT family oligopeptide transporter